MMTESTQDAVCRQNALGHALLPDKASLRSMESKSAVDSISQKKFSMTPLRRRMIEDMQVRNFSPITQRSYLEQVSRFARHFGHSPDTLGPEQIRAYQVYLTQERKLDPGSIIIAVSALRFLYKVTLHKEWVFQEVIPAPKKPQKLPVVLSPEGVLQWLDKRTAVK
jgi:site-specific recombinase XerD